MTKEQPLLKLALVIAERFPVDLQAILRQKQTMPYLFKTAAKTVAAETNQGTCNARVFLHLQGLFF